MQIEELTEQIEKAIDLREANSQHHQDGAPPQDANKPDLPPGLAIHSGKSADQILQELNKSPLFMTELEENDDIAALQALDYEGTASENGASFKERGNECFKVKGYVDAKEFYTKGVQILALEERKRSNGEITKSPDGEIDTEEEIAAQRQMLEAMYGNRAACHLELENYRSCWLDCFAALRLNPQNTKACYRAAKALLAVDRIQESDEMVKKGLEIDQSNKSLALVAEQLASRSKELQRRARIESERLAKESKRTMLLQAALKARGIPVRATDKPPEMEDAKLELVPDPEDPTSSLAFPTVLLYPTDLESDFIKSFNEQQTLEDHLSYVFPLPWDTGKKYTPESVECYIETREGGLLKMGKRMSLLRVLSTGKVEVVDQVVKIFVVPKPESEAWVKKFKEQKAAMLGKR